MAGRGRRVLVVDDDALIRLLLGFTLTEQSWVVLEATSRAEAADVLAREAVDVVVLDESLPDGSGLDLLGDLAESVHVVLYSGSPPATLPAGVDAVMAKGGPPDALLDHLAAL